MGYAITSRPFFDGLCYLRCHWAGRRTELGCGRAIPVRGQRSRPGFSSRSSGRGSAQVSSRTLVPRFCLELPRVYLLRGCFTPSLLHPASIFLTSCLIISFKTLVLPTVCRCYGRCPANITWRRSLFFLGLITWPDQATRCWQPFSVYIMFQQ